MSGSGFTLIATGEAKRVAFRIDRKVNESLVASRNGAANDISTTRRQKTCDGAELSKTDKSITAVVYKQYKDKELSPHKTVKFALTEKCIEILDEFKSNHPYITEDEIAFQVMHTLGVIYGDSKK